MNILKDREFLVSLSIIIAAAVFIFAEIIHWIRFSNTIGPFRLSHWFVWIGTIYIAFAVPIIADFKKRYQNKYKALFRLHVFGNLIAFLLVSIHFAAQISRSSSSFPQLGTGLALYITMILLVATGFTQRFQLIKQIKNQTRRFIHIGLAFSFYLIIGIHIMHGLNIL